MRIRGIQSPQLQHWLPSAASSALGSGPAQMFTSAQEQQENLFTPGNSQRELGTKEPARLSQTDL